MPDALLIETPRAARSGTAGAGIAARLRSEWRLKLALYVVLTAAFCVPYYLIGYHPLHTPSDWPRTSLDSAIPFNPAWAYVYESLFLLIPLAPLMATTRRQLRQYAGGFLLLTLLGLGICLFFPTRCPRPAIGRATGLYAAVAAIDPPNNAFPSMHIALAVQSLLVGWNMLREEKSRRLVPLMAGGTLWLLVIAYATLATKQHYVLDLPAGAALAWMCHHLARSWRHA